MPRDDIHNATDLIRVIRNEVPSRVVHTLNLTNRNGEIRIDARATAPVQVAEQALRGQMTPEEKTDVELMRSNQHRPRLVAAVATTTERARFR